MNNLQERKCVQCKSTCLVDLSSSSTIDNILNSTGVFVTPVDDDEKPFILCDDCAQRLYDQDKLGYGGDGSAFMIRH